jgi:23S rRNA pseudouridine955/2504/2580 synthase
MSSNDNRPAVAMATVTEDQLGQRLDNFLMVRLKGVPKSAIYRMIRKGEVRVNKGRIKPEYKLQVGDVVRIPPAHTKPVRDNVFVGDSLKMQLEAAILYEDDGLIVINKPSGLAVHGGSGVSLGVIEALRLMRPKQRFLELVHRLDRDTSGCLMVAKKRSVLKKLHEDLRDGRMGKTYLALLWGRWNGLEHRIEAPLRKFHLPSGERVVRVSADGKPSLTLFRQLELYGNATLVEAKPITGRTHQIRVHAQFAGHAIAGDDKYLHREQSAYFADWSW